MNAIDSKCLIQVAREGNAGQFAKTLEETGTAVLSNAIETFCKVDRETTQGEESVRQLSDLKSAIALAIRRNDETTKANRASASQRAFQINQGEVPQYPLKKASVVDLHNAKSDLKCGREYELLRREFSAEAATVHAPKPSELSGLQQFLVDLNSIQGLYTAAVMVPGPLSLTVKNFARETADSQAKSFSHFTSDASSDRLFGSGQATAQGSSESSQSSHYEKTTVDERVIPMLSELRERLAQASVVSEQPLRIDATRTEKEATGFKTFILRRTVFNDFFGKEEKNRLLEKLPFQPEFVRLPKSSISDFT